MLRPEQMSKVSVTGAKSVMPTTIETIHELNLVHLSDYGGSWEYFEKGDPIEGAEEASEKLVTIRSLENTLGLEDDEFAIRSIDEDSLEDQLEEIRTSVNDLDDQRSELREKRRELDDRIDRLQPFATLGIDLDLLSGYDSIEVAVGHGPAATIEEALDDSDAVRGYEVFSEGDATALFVAPAEDVDDPLGDALVGVDFSEVEIPDAEGDPEQTITDLEREKQKVDSELESVESELETLKHEHGGFLLSAERYLTIEVDRAEAPLQFATSDRAFVAEGWMPTERYDELVDELRAAVGDRVEIEELERADYNRHGHAATHEEVEPEQQEQVEDSQESDEQEERSVVSDEESEEAVVADGGVVTMDDDEPPTAQKNPSGARSFEMLTRMFGTSNYSEFDPTIILFLTFPLMFGFMIGDIGYGIIYTGIGYYLYSNFDSEALKSTGAIAVAAGLMTVVFGFLYGEVFGLHMFSANWLDMQSLPLLKKGIYPKNAYWAETWFAVTILFGVVHLSIGYVFEFYEAYSLHGLWDAITEAGSWLLALVGLWLLVFSDLVKEFTATTAASGETEYLFLFTVFDEGSKAAFQLGFDGLPAIVGWVGLGMVFVGAGLLLMGPWYEIFEFVSILSHALSYLRISAVLLAKAGMAFAVNVLYFGAYVEETKKGDKFHFLIKHGPEYVKKEEGAELIFAGVTDLGIVGVVGGLAILLAGHLVVLLLGITSSGIQAIRLEYFEFMTKFYEGNGREYEPFGRSTGSSN
jgi:V/A-type H+-transporting ATPase subunit I